MIEQWASAQLFPSATYSRANVPGQEIEHKRKCLHCGTLAHYHVCSPPTCSWNRNTLYSTAKVPGHATVMLVLIRISTGAGNYQQRSLVIPRKKATVQIGITAAVMSLQDSQILNVWFAWFVLAFNTYIFVWLRLNLRLRLSFEIENHTPNKNILRYASLSTC